ncbi:MAG TPA: DNA polymerase III subunit alpha [Bacteroidia bacterium]|nr:DNA polymerase III subunit alpha [Bacteroidia bacterium]HNU32451.1 DNA polymerase III subunit alpha [Bacteroidia bacterium]
MYINCHTYFSFKYGTLAPEDLLRASQANEISTLALTDINNTSGVLDFVRIAPKYKIKPVVGVDFRNGNKQMFVGIAKNNEGYRELNDFLSYHLHNRLEFKERAPIFKHCYVVYPTTAKHLNITKRGEIKFNLREYEYVGLKPKELTLLQISGLKNYIEKLVIQHPVTFNEPGDYNTHRLLRAIDLNLLGSKVDKGEYADCNEIMVHRYELIREYGNYPKIIDNTLKLLDNCAIDFHFGKNKNKKSFTGNVYEDELMMLKLCEENLPYRYPNATEEIAERYKREIKVITELGYSSYFLINWDIINYARHKNYFYIGRGSGANSLVAYLLRITDVDPVELDLYFERFINAYRTSPPDFDIDFSWKDRDDIIDYIFERNGKTNTAQLATYSTFQYNAVIRELGKVFGLPKAEIDALSEEKKHPDTTDKNYASIIKYGKKILDFPNHLGVHAGGILISELPIHYYTGTTILQKGFPITQFSMLEAEDVGLYKFDILSQRGLGHIKDTLEIVKKNQGEEIDIHDIQRFKNDEHVKLRLSEARCMGCFYIESPAMRMLLKKLEVKTYLGLVAASSIIRPGVSSSGMMKEYILRFRGMKASYETPKEIYEILHDTYGVMVYQEDVIKVAHYFAGLTLGEADMLRRGMSGKYRGRHEFTVVEEKFFSNCKQRKIPEATAKEVWRQIESFAGYAFSKGHSASYAVESYQSLFLKTYWPLEHMVAVVNNFGGFYKTEFYLHEARMLGARVHAPDVNKSDLQTNIHGKDIYLGLQHLKEMEDNAKEEILRARESDGLFASLEDFMKRVAISIEQLRILINVGAFRFTGKTKKEMLWDIYSILGQGKKTEVKQELFEMEKRNFKLPPLYYNSIYDAWDEMDILGFPLCAPFDLLAPLPTNLKSMIENNVHLDTAKDLKKYFRKEITITGYMVTYKPTRTKHGESMMFGTFIDKQGIFFDTTHFPAVAAQYPLKWKGCYLIKGRVAEEFGFYSLDVTEMEKLNFIERYSNEAIKEPAN